MTVPGKNAQCKIILPSTHVVYEGISEFKKNIEENEATSPILAYAKSKDFNGIMMIKKFVLNVIEVIACIVIH